MFNFDGEPTNVSKIARALIENSGLNFEPSHDESLTCVVYRKDPLDDYLFVTALSGVRQHEPMFGPLVHDDVRRSNGSVPRAHNPLGFRTRETTRWYQGFGEDDDNSQIYLSGRSSRRKFSRSADEFKRTIYPALRVLLANEENPATPLFPDLWHEERLGRNMLREQFSEVTPGPKVDELAEALTISIRSALIPRLGNNTNHIGIYLKTDRNWSLFGARPYKGRRPATVEGSGETEPDRLNAFAWVDRSTRPVLLRPPLSTVWKKRLSKCSPVYEKVYQSKKFSGICIIPLLDLHQQSRSMGVVTLLSTGDAEVTPAHLFLLSRLALDASGYLTPLLPIVGYPLWPRASLWRGGATVSWRQHAGRTRKLQIPATVVESFVEELLPEGSEVFVKRLQPGHSGSDVYRLGVTDNSGNVEVPRVFKVGAAETIMKEFCAYHQYVHNKSVGGASRLDIAKAKTEEGMNYAGLVYILVGSGEEAKPWSEWAINAPREQINAALAMLHEQLQCWFLGGSGSPTSPTELLITEPFVNKKLQSFIAERTSNPSLKQVQSLLKSVSVTLLRHTREHARTCVVHGDLHAGNIFSLFGRGSRHPDVTSVALIDWGSVASRRHPLSDISKLMADLLYKVRWRRHAQFEDERDWAIKIVKDWGQKTQCRGKEHWRLALMHQIAKMLFYNSDPGTRTPYLSANARRQAWADLKEMAGELGVKS